MDRTLELELLDELLSLHRDRRPFLDEAEAESPVERYISPERFELERERVFRRLPQVACHAAELPEPNSFVRRDVAGTPLVLTRDGAGQAHAFVNACRHRNAQLVREASGCRARLVCPYHAWTYDTSGALLRVPHERAGFPTLDKAERGLARVACREAFGFVWVQLDGDDLVALDDFLGGLAAEFGALDLAAHVPFETTEQKRKCNWKVLVEGGIESYHFKVAHRQTVGKLFEDNLSTYRAEGPHLRSVLARNVVGELADKPREDWRIRDVTNVLYTFMPTFQVLVQADHVIAIQHEPVAHDETRLRLTTLVPANEHTEARAAYWRANHDFTIQTLDEDFEIGEGIQRALATGANTTLKFGRFEGALARFNDAVDAQIGR
ncbi:MAG: SRPBCC family protein [Myxococcota bacterium]